MPLTSSSTNRIGATALALALMGATPIFAQVPKTDPHAGHVPPGQAAPAPGAPGAAATPGMGMPGGGMGGMMPMMQGMMAAMMPAGGMSHMMLHHTEGYLAFLKTELRITAAQEALWTPFADAVRQAAKKAPAPPAARPAGSSHWPDRLADGEAALSARLETMKAFRPAVVTFYAGLTPDQQKKADELTAGPMGMRM